MPVMQYRDKIELGHRCRQVNGGSDVWIVVGFTTDHAGNPHAPLMLEIDRTRIITIACAALNDCRLYERLSGGGLLRKMCRSPQPMSNPTPKFSMNIRIGLSKRNRLTF